MSPRICVAPDACECPSGYGGIHCDDRKSHFHEYL